MPSLALRAKILLRKTVTIPQERKAFTNEATVINMEIMELLEIFLSVIAVFGGYCILDMIKFRLMYPRSVRKNIRGAVILDSYAAPTEAALYIKYLRKEGKISDERLIILVKDDIIKSNLELSGLYKYGEVFKYTECKELIENDETGDGREKSCNS